MGRRHSSTRFGWRMFWKQPNFPLKRVSPVLIIFGGRGLTNAALSPRGDHFPRNFRVLCARQKFIFRAWKTILNLACLPKVFRIEVVFFSGTTAPKSRNELGGSQWLNRLLFAPNVSKNLNPSPRWIKKIPITQNWNSPFLASLLVWLRPPS